MDDLETKTKIKYIRILYTGINDFNPLNAQLNPICHLLALLGAHHIFHVSKKGLRWVNSLQPM